MNDHPTPLNDDEPHPPATEIGATRAGGPTDTADVHDLVDAAVAAYLDFLEGVGPCPTLEDLPDADRREAEQLLAVMTAGRGVDPRASTPSVEELLAGTELESLLTPAGPGRSGSGSSAGSSGRGSFARDTHGDRSSATRHSHALDRHIARAERIKTALHATDRRVAVMVAPHRLAGPAVTATYLDLSAVFFAVDGVEPPTAGEFRRRIESMFNADADLDYVGVVADDSLDLLTQMVSCSDLGPTLVTPSDHVEVTWPPVLPLPDAFRRMLELAAPIWEPFVFDASLREPLQLQAVAGRAAQQIVTGESARPYHGDKGRAYKSFAGADGAFREMIVALGAHAATEHDVAEALDRVLREAA